MQEVSTTPGYQPAILQAINPANPGMFPRLSSLANVFERWAIHSLAFKFATGCNATTPGAVLQYIDYDVADQAATSAVQLLANESAQVKPVWEDSTIVMDAKRLSQPSFFTNSNPNAVLTTAEARQDFAGFYRCFTDRGGATPVFAGYVYVEYDIELYAPKPANPIAITAAPLSGSTTTTDIGSTSLGAASVIPYGNILSNSGVVASAAQNPSSAYLGVQGAVDAARSVYEAGNWLVSSYNAYRAASATVKKEQKFIDRWDEKCQWEDASATKSYRVTRQTLSKVDLDAGVKPLAPNALNDVSDSYDIWDCTNGLDPNFPVSVTGMSLVATDTMLVNNAAAFNLEHTYIMTVPTGKRYVIEHFFTPDAATYRYLNSTNSLYSVASALASPV
jgi:hypothetical protein